MSLHSKRLGARLTGHITIRAETSPLNSISVEIKRGTFLPSTTLLTIAESLGYLSLNPNLEISSLSLVDRQGFSVWGAYTTGETYTLKIIDDLCPSSSSPPLSSVVHSVNTNTPCVSLTTDQLLNQTQWNVKRSDANVYFAYDTKLLTHAPEASDTRRIPELPIRLERTYEVLLRTPECVDIVRNPDVPLGDDRELIPNPFWIFPKEVTIKDVLRCHPSVAFEKFVCDGTSLSSLMTLPSDVYCIEKVSNRAACLAAGMVVEAVRTVWMASQHAEIKDDERFSDGGKESHPSLPIGFCLVRPPGHHCTSTTPGGFCLLNNVMIAARHLRDTASYSDGTCRAPQRIVIIDVDVHHGNGTQELAEQDPGILYCSIHRYDEGKFYPYSPLGRSDYIGDKFGNIVNIAFNTSAQDPMECHRVISDEVFMETMKCVILPRLDAFDPELIIVSAGFDAIVDDPLGGMAVEHGISYALRVLKEWVLSRRNVKTVGPSHKNETTVGIVVVLEGGYNPDNLANAVRDAIITLRFPSSDPEVLKITAPVTPRTWEKVRQKQLRRRKEYDIIQMEKLEEKRKEANDINLNIENPPKMCTPPVSVESNDRLSEKHTQWIREQLDMMSPVYENIGSIRHRDALLAHSS